MNYLRCSNSLYIQSLIGKTVRGETSGVRAKIENFITNTQSERDNYTLYLKYQSSSDNDFLIDKFLDGENLVAEEDIFYGVSAIRDGSTFATTIIQNSTEIGSAVKIASGVYFVRGFFVEVVYKQ